MIDTLTETVVALAEAPDHCPRRRGKKLHVATLYRWKDEGLETLLVGGLRCTSLQALQRFFERRTAERDGATPTGATIARTSARRMAESERAARQLERMGA